MLQTDSNMCPKCKIQGKLDEKTGDPQKPGSERYHCEKCGLTFERPISYEAEEGRQ